MLSHLRNQSNNNKRWYNICGDGKAREFPLKCRSNLPISELDDLEGSGIFGLCVNCKKALGDLRLYVHGIGQLFSNDEGMNLLNKRKVYSIFSMSMFSNLLTQAAEKELCSVDHKKGLTQIIISFYLLHLLHWSSILPPPLFMAHEKLLAFFSFHVSSVYDRQWGNIPRAAYSPSKPILFYSGLNRNEWGKMLVILLVSCKDDTRGNTRYISKYRISGIRSSVIP